MRFIALSLLALLTASCSTFQSNVLSAGDIAVNPERREVHYLRDGNTIHYYRFDCSGDFCE